MLLRKSRGLPAFGFFARRSHPTFAATALGGLLVAASTGSALSHGCMPNHARPLVILKDMGPCSFDRQTMSFAGEPVEQAKCLMRGMDATRNLGLLFGVKSRHVSDPRRQRGSLSSGASASRAIWRAPR